MQALSGDPGKPQVWQTTRFDIDLRQPRVMGIVNATPDSFSDGGRFKPLADILACCERLLAEGADILDIGGESTRPGASPVPIELEEARVLPVLKHALRLGCAVSVDTSEPRLMQKALDLGADIINDVRALRRPGALQTVASAQRAGLCLMHMRGEPADMQADPQYGDVVAEVAAFLSERLDAAGAAGIAPERIVLDPGFGFGKTDAHNQGLAQGLPRLQALGRPLLVGWSRKGTLGRLTDRPLHERQSASLAAALAAVAGGAVLLRVHDVAATVDALKVWRALSPQT